jgi:hypothetical protein
LSGKWDRKLGRETCSKWKLFMRGNAHVIARESEAMKQMGSKELELTISSDLEAMKQMGSKELELTISSDLMNDRLWKYAG